MQLCWTVKQGTEEAICCYCMGKQQESIYRSRTKENWGNLASVPSVLDLSSGCPHPPYVVVDHDHTFSTLITWLVCSIYYNMITWVIFINLRQHIVMFFRNDRTHLYHVLCTVTEDLFTLYNWSVEWNANPFIVEKIQYFTV